MRKLNRTPEEKLAANKVAQKKTYAKYKLDYYMIYYLPQEHYVGITTYPKYRMKQHKLDKHDTTGWRVLYCSEDKADAYYHEALFQSTLGINGIKLH